MSPASGIRARSTVSGLGGLRRSFRQADGCRTGLGTEGNTETLNDFWSAQLRLESPSGHWFKRPQPPQKLDEGCQRLESCFRPSKARSPQTVKSKTMPVRLLKRIRNEINILRNRLYQSLGKILERHSSSQAIQDEVITLRNERFVIPVRVENRKELPGVVHGTSSSGATLFLEPLETLELNNELVRLKERAEEEIQNILRSLTASIRERLEDLRLAVETLGYLDFSFAKARFSKEFRCVIPEVNDEGLLAIVDGRHPTLERTLSAQQKRGCSYFCRTRQPKAYSGYQRTEYRRQDRCAQDRRVVNTDGPFWPTRSSSFGQRLRSQGGIHRHRRPSVDCGEPEHLLFAPGQHPGDS